MITRRKGPDVLLGCRVLFLALLLHAALASAQTSIGSLFPIASGWLSTGGAFDGTNYLIGLESDKQTAKVAAQLISQTGARVGPLIAVGTNGQSCCNAVAFDGTNYLMVWEDDQGIKNSWTPFRMMGQFISTAGVALGQPFAITGPGISADGVRFLAYGGGKYLVTYVRLIVPANGDNSTNRTIAGRIISPDGTMGSEFRVSSGYGSESTIGFDGSNFFVVWREDSLDYEVRGRFVSPSGVLGQEISVNASPAASDSVLAVGFDGTNYMVVYSDDGGAAPVTPTPALIAGTWVLSSTNNSNYFPSGSTLAVDAGGSYSSTLPGCTHTGTFSVSGSTYVMTALTSTASGCMVPGTVITGLLEMTANTVKVYNGSSWGLFQRTSPPGAGGMLPWDVFAQRVSPAGALVGGVITISNEPGPQVATGVAFDGSNYLTTWTDMQSSTNWDIYGRYVAKDGSLAGDKFAITTAAGNQLGGGGGYANGKHFIAVNTGVELGQGGPIRVGDVSGLFVSIPQPPPSPTQPVAPPPPTQTAYTVSVGRLPEAAVTTVASGTLGRATVSVTLDLSKIPLGGTLASEGRFAAGYNVYVAALVPAGILNLPSATWFMLRARPDGWATLSSPIAAYLQGVAQGAANTLVQVPILENLDVTALVGAEIYIGYGLSSDEMLAAGRYRGVYIVR